MKIKRTRPFVDTLELEDGDKQLTVSVSVHFERSAPLIRKAQMALIEAEKAIQQDKKNPNNLETYGNAVIALFAAVFGEQETGEILQFYEGQYTDMLTDILPYILYTVLPAMQLYQRQKVEQMTQARKKIKRQARKK
jgi:hypothetical protein